MPAGTPAAEILPDHNIPEETVQPAFVQLAKLNPVVSRFFQRKIYYRKAPQCYWAKNAPKPGIYRDGKSKLSYFALPIELKGKLEKADPVAAQDAVAVLLFLEAGDLYARGKRAVDTVAVNAEGREKGRLLALRFLAGIDEARREKLRQAWTKLEKDLGMSWEELTRGFEEFRTKLESGQQRRTAASMKKTIEKSLEELFGFIERGRDDKDEIDDFTKKIKKVARSDDPELAAMILSEVLEMTVMEFATDYDPGLADELELQRPYVEVLVAELLRFENYETARRALQLVLRSPNPTLKEIVTKSLANSKEDFSVSALLELLGDPTVSLQKVARDSLIAMSGNWAKFWLALYESNWAAVKQYSDWKATIRAMVQTPSAPLHDKAVMFMLKHAAEFAAAGPVAAVAPRQRSESRASNVISEIGSFIVIEEGGKRYLTLKEGPYKEEFKSFKVEVNGEFESIPDGDYFESASNVRSLVDIIEGLARQDVTKRPLYVIGEEGCGKNWLIYFAAQLMRRNVRFMSFHEDVHEDDLIERRGLGEKEQGKSDYIESPFTTAVREGDIFLGDEVNKAKPAVRSKLNNLYETRRVDLHDGTSVKAKRTFAAVFTANPGATGRDSKVYQVDADSAELMDRAPVIYVDYLPPDEEKAFLFWRLMKKRKLKDTKGISADETTLVDELVKAANRLRESYMGKDKAGSSQGRGNAVQRPFSTRALENIIQHIALYPGDIKRVRAIIRRYYPYDLDVERKEQITNVEAVLDSYTLLKRKDPVAFTEKDLEGPVYGTNAAGQSVLRFKDLEIPVRPGAPRDISEIEWDRRPDWTPTNLSYLYNLLQDFKRDKHMLLAGDAGAGKDFIAEYLARLIYGNVEVFNVTNNTLVEDLIAYVGLGEGERKGKDGRTIVAGKGETGVVLSYVVRAMRAGKPVILSEINKAKPETLAVLNNILQFGWVELPNGIRIKAEPGFCIIGTMNPSSDKRYRGNFRLSAEFLARFSHHWFDLLPLEEEIAILKKFNKKLRAEHPDGASFNILKEELIRRMVILVQELRKKGDKLSHPVSLRPLKDLVARFSEHPDYYPARFDRLATGMIYFPEQTGKDILLQAIADSKVKDIKGDIIEYMIETGDASLDVLLELFKIAGNDPTTVLEALRNIDGYILKKKTSSPGEVFKKARDLFAQISAGKDLTAVASKKEIGTVLALFMADVSNNLSDPAKSEPLPKFVEIIPAKGKWDLAKSTELVRKAIGEKISGILRVAGQKEPVAFLESGGRTYLTVALGTTDEEALKQIDEVHGNIMIGESKGLDHATAQIFADYVTFLGGIKEDAAKIDDKQKGANAKVEELVTTVLRDAKSRKLGLDAELLKIWAGLWTTKSPILTNSRHRTLKELLEQLKLSAGQVLALSQAIPFLDPEILKGYMPDSWPAARSEARKSASTANGRIAMSDTVLRTSYFVPTGR